MKIAFLGCGNMASAVAEGIKRHYQSAKILTYTPSKTKAEALAKKVDGQVYESLQCVEEADFTVIGCKPYQFNELSASLKEFDLSKTCFVSIMAGVELNSIEKKLGTDRVIRLMPSMAMQNDEGISLIIGAEKATSSDISNLINMLKGSSFVYEAESEDQFDKLTVITASGPAFVYYLIQSFYHKLKDWGLDEAMAKKLSTKVFSGATTALSLSEDTIDDHISKVTSKKGMTIEGLNSFSENEVAQKISEGLEQAFKRSQEIKAEAKN